jgi:NAD(P)-dependent dehydrogenase (short-subunit alcohol dehydrogenase family)
MRLEGKVAVIYGGGGSIGRAMARAFAREGATVHLAGRSQPGLEQAAAEIRDAGGAVRTAQLDARDEGAVDGYADSVATPRAASTFPSTRSRWTRCSERLLRKCRSKTSNGRFSTPYVRRS